MTIHSRKVPIHSESPATVVHAGFLLRDSEQGLRALRSYLRRLPDGDPVLVHDGESGYAEVAHEAGVPEMKVEDASAEEEALAATAVVSAFGAESLEFAIDTPTLVNAVGAPIRDMTERQAERMAAEGGLRRPIRAKLRAACEALRIGARRVRIGSPAALLRDRATVIVRDPAIPLRGPTPLPAASPGGMAKWSPELPLPLQLAAANRGPWDIARKRAPWQRRRVGSGPWEITSAPAAG